MPRRPRHGGAVAVSGRSPPFVMLVSMIVPPLAHAGHWLAQLAYLLPLIVLVGMLVAGKLRERRERRRGGRVTDA